MKRYILLALALCAVATFATACGEEQEIEYIESNDETTLSQMLQVPETLDVVMDSDDDGNATISIATSKIVMPDDDVMYVTSYEIQEITSEYKQGVAEAIFDDAEIYAYNEVRYPTEIVKELANYYRDCIESMEAEGIDSTLYNDMLKDLNNEYMSGGSDTLAEDYSADKFFGTINGKWYLLDFAANGGGYTLKRYPEELQYDMLSASNENYTYAYNDVMLGDSLEQELLETNDTNISEMTAGDAEEFALNYFSDLGVASVTVMETISCIWQCVDYLWISDDMQSDCWFCEGYLVTLQQSVEDATPFFANYDTVESLALADDGGIISTKDGYTSKYYQMCITDKGIVSLTCQDVYVATGESVEATLLKFEDVLEKAVANITDYYANCSKSSGITFNYVELTYMMIAEDETASMTPVWVFAELDDLSLYYGQTLYPTELYVVNAITGEPLSLYSDDY